MTQPLEQEVIEKRKQRILDHSLDLDKILSNINGRVLPSVKQIDESVNYVKRNTNLNIVILERFPQLLAYSIENNIKPKVEYITKGLHLDISVFESHPALWGYSLNRRIKPRVAFLENKRKYLSLMTHIAMNDEVFCNEIAKCSLKEYQEFKERYVELMS